MMVEVVTSRFGTIQVPEERVILFPKGLIGFENLKRFVRLDSTKGLAVQWLQALDDPDTAFLVSEPRTYLPSFELRLLQADASQAQNEGLDLKKLEVLTIMHVDRAGRRLHVHVQAPLLLDPVSRRGVQVITDAENPTISVPLKTP